jgi:hypothetical protein
LVLFAAGLSACGSDDPSSLPYRDSEVVISGVAGEDFPVTIAELAALELVSEKAEAARSNGDIVKITAVGPTLETFLAQYGKKQSDYSAVRFTATDGYSISVGKEILEKREIVLALMDGNKAFDKGKSAPLRAVVIGERAMYWARMVCKIEFETGTESSVTSKVVFLDTVLPSMESKYSEEEGGELVSTIDLLSEYGGLSEGEKVYMSAFDGLQKTETIENFLKGYIKYTGENAPQFCSPDLPEGMNLNGIVTARTGSVVYFSPARGTGIMPEKEAAGHKGLGFSDIIKEMKFMSVQVYQITDAAGQTHLMSEHELAAGVFAEEGGTWNFYIADGDTIEGAAEIEAIRTEQEE